MEFKLQLINTSKKLMHNLIESLVLITHFRVKYVNTYTSNKKPITLRINLIY